ncbi:putative metallopeptidase [Metapseudomonas otitidis]|uniref:putative metallopeptidase n=1 Tax=Metapseudomonas otitidis TaxID=319939 RepID=UPI002447F893|nr:putative metallopeptidase [Pseudomonas otitidis]MDH0335183.1 putative metallopeptidase [Pseudomonas otitidis]
MARPFPPEAIGQFAEGADWADAYIPAPEVLEWAVSTFVEESGALFNPDHAHLKDASIAFLWAASGYEKQGRLVLGQCEELTFRCSAWQKGRQEQQMIHWFGGVPDFLITLAADYCVECSDAEFCALVEHELYHMTQKTNSEGEPQFTDEGQPKLKLRGHDVEEFVGVVRRYGASEGVKAMVEAANKAPEVAKINIARACGTCLLKSA